MAFNLEEARRRGINDDEIVGILRTKVPNFNFDVALQRGSLDEAVDFLNRGGHLKVQPVQPEKGIAETITSGLEFTTGIPSFVSDVVRAIGVTKGGSYIPIGKELFNKSFEEGKHIANALEKTTFTEQDLTNEQLESFRFYQKFAPVKEKAKKDADFLKAVAENIVPEDTKERITEAQTTTSSVDRMVNKVKKEGFGGLATDIVLANTSQIANILASAIPLAQPARLTGSMAKDLESIGVTDDVIQLKWATMGGIASGSMEQASDIVLGKIIGGGVKSLKNLFGKKATAELGEEVVKKSITKLLAKNIALYGVELGQQGLEEVFQGTVEDGIKLLAIQEQLTKTTNQEQQQLLLKNLEELSNKTLGDYSEEFIGGVTGSLLLGGFGSVTQTIGDVAEARQVNRDIKDDKKIEGDVETLISSSTDASQVTTDDDVSLNKDFQTQEQIEAQEALSDRPPEIQEALSRLGQEPSQTSQEAVESMGDTQPTDVTPDPASDQITPSKAVTEESVAGERRTDVARRKKIDEMTEEEKTIALQQDELTGLKSRRAWEDIVSDATDSEINSNAWKEFQETTPKQGIIDADGLKSVNDKFGHEYGDLLLKEISGVLKESGVNAFRIGGDEIRFVGDQNTEINIQEAQEKLKNIEIIVADVDGNEYIWKGMGFSYGIVDNKDYKNFKEGEQDADKRLLKDKEAREKAGLRAARGAELPGLVKKPTVTEQDKVDTVQKVESEVTKEVTEPVKKEPVDVTKPAGPAGRYNLAQLDAMSRDQLLELAKDPKLTIKDAKGKVSKSPQNEVIKRAYIRRFPSSLADQREVTRRESEAKGRKTIPQQTGEGIRGPQREDTERKKTQKEREEEGLTTTKPEFRTAKDVKEAKEGQQPVKAVADVTKEPVFQNFDPEDARTVSGILNATEETSYDSKQHDKLIEKGVITKYTREGKTFVEPNFDAKPGSVFLSRQSPVSGKPISSDKQVKLVKFFSEKINKSKLKSFNIIFGKLFKNRFTGKTVDLSKKPDGGIYGGLFIAPNRQHVDVAISSDLNVIETIKTLAEELWGHYGAMVVFSNNKGLKRRRHQLFLKEQNSKFVQDLRKAYKPELAKMEAKYGKAAAENLLENEWFAHTVADFAAEEFFDSEGNLKDTATPRMRSVWEIIKDWVAKTFGGTDRQIRQLTQQVIRDISKYGELRVKESKPITAMSLRPPKKHDSNKIRLKAKTVDRAKLETATTKEKFNPRLISYISNHVFSPGVVDQVVDLANAIETYEKNDKGQPVDPSLRKIFDLFDRDSRRGDLSRVTSKRNLIKKATKKGSEDSKTKASNLLKLYDTVDEFRRLETFVDSAKKRRLVKLRDDGTLAIGKVTQELLDKGYLTQKIVEEDGKKNTYVFLTKKGQAKYDSIVKDMNENWRGIDQEILDPVSYVSEKKKDFLEAQAEFNQIKGEVAEKKKAATEKSLNEITTQFEADKDITKDKEVQKPISKAEKKSLKKLAKQFNLKTFTLESLSDMMDKFKDGAIYKNILEPLLQGESDAIAFDKKAHEILGEISKVLKGKELDAFSDSFHRPGYLAKIQRGIKGDPVKTEEFTDANNEKFSLTADQKLSIFRIARQRDGYRHLISETGGLILPGENSPRRIDARVIDDIVSSLTAKEKKVNQILDKYFKFQAEEINKVSQQDLGYNLADVENYHPIRVRKYDTVFKDTPIKPGQEFNGWMNEMHFNNLQRRTKAANPIMLENTFDAIARTESQIADYVGFKLAHRKVRRILDGKVNYKGRERSFKEYMDIKGLGDEYNQINTLLNQVIADDSGRKGRWALRALKLARNLNTVGLLGLNPVVALLQPISYLGSLTQRTTSGISLEISPKKIIEGVNEFMEHSNFVWDRYQNHIDRDIGETFDRALARKLVKGDNRLKFDPGNLLTSEGVMSPITFADAIAIGRIIQDVKVGLKNEGIEYGTKDYWDKAVPEVERIIRKTQPTFGKLHRPEITDIELLKPFTMFTSQPVKNLQMVRRGVGLIKQGKVKEGLRDLSIVMVVQPALVALAREGVRALRGKEDDEGFFEKWFKGFITANIGIYPMIGSMLSNSIQGYDWKRSSPLVENIDNFLSFNKNLYNKLTGNKKVENEKLIKQAKKVLQSAGIAANGPTQMWEILDTQYKNVKELVD